MAGGFDRLRTTQGQDMNVLIEVGGEGAAR
jgi:hypothetical protein